MQHDMALALPSMTTPDPLGGFDALSPSSMGNALDGKTKAAIVVRLLLNEGADIPIEDLPEGLQAALTQQMGRMGLVDRDTLHSVANEFAEILDNVGLTFPKGLAGALTAMEGKISRQTATRLRKEAGVRQFGNPWECLRNLAAKDLAELAEAESTEVAAVLLSKLDTAKAAEMLSELPGPVARRITYAVSQTGAVTPDTVDRIGLSLAAQIEARPEIAFDETPGERIGAILTQSQAAKREEVLIALDEEDEEFATDVRKSIFTFALIYQRVSMIDVPRIIRLVPQPDLVTAFAYAKIAGEDETASAEFMLANMSNRMANNIREEVGERGKVKATEGELAMASIVNVMRELVSSGEMELQLQDDDDDEDG